jgi:hypothetical protein
MQKFQNGLLRKVKKGVSSLHIQKGHERGNLMNALW